MTSTLGTLGARLGMRPGALRHAGLVVTASILGFISALALGIENPYWAAMPPWVVAQATRGLTWERSVLRLLGTVIGAAFGLTVIQVTREPIALILALGIWIAGCAFTAQVLRGVHAYGALLCGMTAAVVLCPAFLDPNHTRELALARIECTLIGVVFASLLPGMLSPDSRRSDFYSRVRALACDALDFSSATLRGDAPTAQAHRLLVAISETEATAGLVTAGSVDGYRRLHHVHALIYAAIEVMAASRAERPSKPGQAEAMRELAALLRRSTPGRRPDPAWNAAIAEAAAHSPRLERALTQLMAAELALFTTDDAADSRSFGRKLLQMAPHYDLDDALRLGFTCGGSVVLVALCAMVSGWKAGVLATLGVCIFCLILGTVPDPRGVSARMAAGVFAGAAAGAAHRLWIQPHLGSSLWLVVSLLPVLLLGAVARCIPALAITSVDLVMCFLLASQAGVDGSFPPSLVLAGAGALVTAVLSVTGAIHMAPRRNRGRDRARALRKDLRALIENGYRKGDDWGQQSSRHVMHLILHLCRPGSPTEESPAELLPVINLGHDIVSLQSFSRDPEESSLLSGELRCAEELLSGAASSPLQTAEKLDQLAGQQEGRVEETFVRFALCLRALAANLRASAPVLDIAELNHRSRTV